MQPVGPAHLLNHKAAERLNLAVLKRMDSATEEVCHRLPVFAFGPALSSFASKEATRGLM